LLTVLSYFKDGTQINTPMDVEIAQYIEKNLVPWPDAWRDPRDASPSEIDPYMKNNAYWDVIMNYTGRVLCCAV